jgi:hypothetical protein
MRAIIDCITNDWLSRNHPCSEAIKWWDKKERDPLKILNLLISNKKYKWANWYIVRIMTEHDYISYAVFAAEQVIGIYEKEESGRLECRCAIEAARRCISEPTDKNKRAADAAADALIGAVTETAEEAVWAAAEALAGVAGAAEAAAEAATGVAGAAEAAAKAAAWAVAMAAVSALAGAVGAAEAAEAAAKAVVDKSEEMLLKILNYGVKLLNDEGVKK